MKTVQLPAEDGSVPKADVLHVLKSVSPGLGISLKISEDGCQVTLVKDGTPEVISLKETRVTRRMLQRFSKKYGIRIEFFFHPEMCCSGNDSRH